MAMATGRIEYLRILVVEDEMLVSMLMQDMLAALGHTVVGPAASVANALATLAQESVDAALLDVNLGGHEVYPVADALVARDVPFAFVTGYDSRGVTPPWTSKPRLDKPFRQTDLERLLIRLLSAP